MTNLAQYMRARESVLLVGPPGIGKTARIIAAAKEAGYAHCLMRASLAERIDFGGALVPDVDAGVTRALPLATLKRLRETEAPTLLFLDDLGQAPMDVQAACMSLFDPGALGPNVLIWGATNRPGDKAGVSALCEPLRSRFALAFAIAGPDDAADGEAVTLRSWGDEVAAWIDYAISRDADPAIIAWHRASGGRTLYQWRPSANPAARMADFRSWDSIIRLYAAGIRDSASVAAVVGKAVAAEFTAFAALAADLPSVDEVFSAPDTARVPENPSALYLISTALAMRVDAVSARAFLTYTQRLSRVYTALAMRDAVKRSGAALLTEPAFSAWYIANQAMFTVKGGSK